MITDGLNPESRAVLAYCLHDWAEDDPPAIAAGWTAEAGAGAFLALAAALRAELWQSYAGNDGDPLATDLMRAALSRVQWSAIAAGLLAWAEHWARQCVRQRRP